MAWDADATDNQTAEAHDQVGQVNIQAAQPNSQAAQAAQAPQAPQADNLVAQPWHQWQTYSNSYLHDSS